MKTPPVSHEGLILRKLRAALTDMPAVQYASGMGSANRFPLQGWNLVGQQQFQFGDLRIETPTTTIVVEAESAGGVTNLAKYWPYVEGRPAKPCPAGRRSVSKSPRVSIWCRAVVETTAARHAFVAARRSVSSLMLCLAASGCWARRRAAGKEAGRPIRLALAHSWMIGRADLPRLHCSHAVIRLSSEVSPPSEYGTTWSTCNKAPSRALTPQYWQRKLSR